MMMNINQTPAATTSSNGQDVEGTAGRGESTPKNEPRCARDATSRDAFERALQTKQQPSGAALLQTKQKPTSSGEDACPPEGAAPALAWMAAPLVRVADAAPVVAGAIAEPATGTRAAIEAALNHSVPHDSGPVNGSDRPAVWEASIGGAGGTVELRAERIAVQGAQPTWGLTIGAQTLGDAAARHAPRLHDRLRKHGIDVDHVRIERDRDDRDD